MSEFQIEDRGNMGSSNARLPQQSASEKGMLGFLMQKGIVKSENVGNLVLIGVAVFFFAMSVLVFYVL